MAPSWRPWKVTCEAVGTRDIALGSVFPFLLHLPLPSSILTKPCLEIFFLHHSSSRWSSLLFGSLLPYGHQNECIIMIFIHKSDSSNVERQLEQFIEQDWGVLTV